MEEQRLGRIEAKLDKMTDQLHAVVLQHEARLTKVETTQKGVVALCVAILTASLTALAKALHLA